MKILKKLIILFLSVSMLFIAGCGKSKRIPEPPTAETNLVYEFFSALKSKDYQMAEQKIKMLRALNPKDIYLENIQQQIMINLCVQKTQNLLDVQKIDEAIASIQTEIATYGRQPVLLETLNTLNTLKKIEALTLELADAQSPEKMAVASAELKKLVKDNPYSKSLSNFAENILEESKVLALQEKASALKDLKADLDISFILGNPVIDTLLAELDIELSGDSQVIAYKKAMSKDWNKLNISNDYDDPSYELLIFRMALYSNKNEKQKIFQKLLFLPPNNFSSTIVRIIILESFGYGKEAKALENKVLKAIPEANDIKQNWFRFEPETLDEINEINPFVLYPFLMYCGEVTH